MNKTLKNIHPKLTLEKMKLLYDRIDFSKPIEVVDILYLKDVEPHRKRYIGNDGIYRKSTNGRVLPKCGHNSTKVKLKNKT